MDIIDTVYDKALKEVGGDGKFQKSFDIIYNLLFITLWCMTYLGIVLVLAEPPHRCEVPIAPDNVSEIDWISKHIPIVTDSGEIKFSNCLIFTDPDHSNTSKECYNYTYDTTWYEATAVSDNNWVCENDIYIAKTFSYSKIGELFGSVAFGWFGDVYGRKIPYIISLVFIIVGRLLSALAGNTYTIFVAGCIIASFPSWTANQSITVISLETTSEKRRNISLLLRSVACTFGSCLAPLIYWWLRDWKLYLIVITATQIPFLLLSWMLIESPRWLWLEGKSQKCIKELKRIAKVNSKTLTEETEFEILNTPPLTGKNDSYGPLALFSNWTLGLNTTLVLYLWVAVTLTYTTLLMSFGKNENSNPYLEFVWLSAAELPGTFIGAALSDKIGRRNTTSISLGITTGLWILTALRNMSTYSWTKQGWVTTVLLMLNRLSITTAYYSVSFFNMEMYPTCVRQSGMALGNVVTSAASAVTPYIIWLGAHVDARLTGVILGGTSLLGILCSLLLPETLNAKLPETLEDTKYFGKNNKKYASVPTATKKDQNTDNDIDTTQLRYEK